MKFKLKRWHLVLVFLSTPYFFWWVTPIEHAPLILINCVMGFIIMFISFYGIVSDGDFKKLEKFLDFGEKDE